MVVVVVVVVVVVAATPTVTALATSLQYGTVVYRSERREVGQLGYLW